MYSHIGKRKQNQDATLITSSLNRSGDNAELFAIADGMGGHPGGLLASDLACNELNHFFEEVKINKFSGNPDEIVRHLTDAIIRIDLHIRLQGIKNRKLEDMGTTLSCLVLTNTHTIIAHVGDARIYRLRKGYLTCLTIDHTFVQDMIFEGEVDPKDAHTHPLRNVLTRVVGTKEPLELVDTRIDSLQIDDMFLLCTDGLYNTLDSKHIRDLLLIRSVASATANKLVMSAYQKGARDNITAIAINL